jgi:hypothetical protein
MSNRLYEPLATKRQAFNVVTTLCLIFVVADTAKDIMLRDWAALGRLGLVALIVLLLSLLGVFKPVDKWLDEEDDDP